MTNRCTTMAYAIEMLKTKYPRFCKAVGQRARTKAICEVLFELSGQKRSHQSLNAAQCFGRLRNLEPRPGLLSKSVPLMKRLLNAG